MNPKINRLFCDIETSPNIGFFWKAGHKQFINYDSIIQERAIICIGFKWEHQKQAQCIYWDDRQDDREMLQEFVAIANTADEIVMHNGDSFDLPWLRTRCLLHGIPMMPAYKTIDTLQWARRKFYFNSNRLDYIGKYLGVGGKIKTELELWKRVVLKNDRKAMRGMGAYCMRDVEMLGKIYAKLEAYVPHKTHVGVLNGRDKWTSPFTGGTKVKKNCTKVTANGAKQHQMQCLATGRTYSISEAVYADYQEWRKSLGSGANNGAMKPKVAQMPKK